MAPNTSQTLDSLEIKALRHSFAYLFSYAIHLLYQSLCKSSLQRHIAPFTPLAAFLVSQEKRHQMKHTSATRSSALEVLNMDTFPAVHPHPFSGSFVVILLRFPFKHTERYLTVVRKNSNTILLPK